MKKNKYISSLTEVVICHLCNGWGRYFQANGNHTCPRCDGKGMVKKVSTFYKLKS